MVLHPMSQGQIPQVSASAEDQESSGGHAGMLSQELAGKKLSQQAEETQLPVLHVVVSR